MLHNAWRVVYAAPGIMLPERYYRSRLRSKDNAQRGVIRVVDLTQQKAKALQFCKKPKGLSAT